jgi:hypothetical protein
MYLEALGREPVAAETAAALGFLASQARDYGLAADAALTEVSVWADLGHVLYNVKEFAFIN